MSVLKEGQKVWWKGTGSIGILEGVYTVIRKSVLLDDAWIIENDSGQRALATLEEIDLEK